MFPDLRDTVLCIFQDNKRRRTPGGVFLQLLKFDSPATKEQIKEIFEEENAIYKKERWGVCIKSKESYMNSMYY